MIEVILGHVECLQSVLEIDRGKELSPWHGGLRFRVEVDPDETEMVNVDVDLK